MGIVIRVAFNNQAWKGACLRPLGDPRHYQCREQRVQVGPIQEDEKGFCNGSCWERELCIKYRWENVLGNWGPRTYQGAKVYFVYRDQHGAYTLWGKSEVTQVKGKEILFAPFSPLPVVKWRKNLADSQLVGKSWRQGFYRYVRGDREDYLDHLIEDGSQPGEQGGSSGIVAANASSGTVIRLKPPITAKLERIAAEEGREVEDLVREAIGEWLKGRSA